ncbi:cystatin-like protein [Salminus brasiliensis]|uniref:cystatin-like protein n=1 Tax=Salminus brasiliensis TaxID=930266 RepID=UPI003B83156F
MCAALKLLLFSAVILQLSAQGWNNYRSLPEDYRTHIDKALLSANKKMGGPYHVAFEKVLFTPTLSEDRLYVNVRLFVTTCKKNHQKGFGHRDECVTQKPKTPWINCLVCTRGNGGELIDCAKQAEVDSRRTIRDECSVYHHGSGNTLSLKAGTDEQTFGCSGCV